MKRCSTSQVIRKMQITLLAIKEMGGKWVKGTQDLSVYFLQIPTSLYFFKIKREREKLHRNIRNGLYFQSLIERL